MAWLEKGQNAEEEEAVFGRETTTIRNAEKDLGRLEIGRAHV